MKKFLTLAMALCICGAASAITLTWNGGTTLDANSGDITGGTLDKTTNFSSGSAEAPLTVSFVIGGIDASTVGWMASQNVTLFTVYGANGWGEGTADGSGNTPKTCMNMYIKDGSVYWGVAGNKGYGDGVPGGGNSGYKPSNPALGTVADIFGSGEDVTFTITKTANTPEAISISINDGTPTPLVANDSNAFGFANYDWERADVSSVPEPTALALLALGVAGLALKRKNA